MNKLLKCPFCGGEAVIQGVRDRALCFALCVDCRMRTPSFQDLETAIRAWNTRTPMDNIVEKLEREKSKSIYDSDGAISVKDAYAKSINIVKQEINNGLE